jgi:hypothetical protein
VRFGEVGDELVTGPVLKGVPCGSAARPRVVMRSVWMWMNAWATVDRGSCSWQS